MNKFQRAKSKRIKKLQREMPGISYKKAKRLDRKIMRGANRLAYEVQQLGRGFQIFSRGISKTALLLALLRKELS